MIDWEQAWAFLTQPLMLPLTITAVAGFIAYIAARAVPAISSLMSLVAAGAAFALSVGLFRGESIAVDQTWMEIGGFRIAVAMSSGVFGSLMAMAAAFFALLIAIYALRSERGGPGMGRFHAFLCWTLTGVFGAAHADDLIWLLICWEVVSLCLYMLLNLGQGDYRAGAAKTLAMIGFGDAAMLLAIALIGATEGTFRIAELSIQVGTPVTYLCYLLFVAAALAKAGGMPLHSWIPSAAEHASAATFALLPASIDKLLGVLLLVRVSFEVFVLDAAMQTTLMVIGAVTVVAAAAMASQQTTFKKLVAFQAVGSTGYIVLGIGTALPIGIAGAVFHGINGAVYQACLLLVAGIIERRYGTDDLNRLGGLARALPGAMICCVVGGFAIAGIPPLNGFVSKWLVYQSCLGVGSVTSMICLLAAVFGSALTLAASFKLVGSTFLGQRGTAARSPANVGRSPAMMLPVVVLAILCVGLGVVAQWPMQTLILPAIADATVATPDLNVGVDGLAASTLGIWGPVPATVLILLGILGGLTLYVIGRASNVRVTNTFIGGEVLADETPLRVPAGGFYRTLEELDGVGGALRDGARGAYDVYRISGRCGGSFVDVLKRQHTGVLSLYVSWCLVGVVVIVAYLMSVI